MITIKHSRTNKELILDDFDFEEVIYAVYLRKESLLDSANNYNCDHSKELFPDVLEAYNKLRNLSKTEEELQKEAREFYKKLNNKSNWWDFNNRN